MTKTTEPIHPGEVLYEDFFIPLGVTQHHLAVSIAVPPPRINEIVHGKRRITADAALRLARYFGTSDRFWLNLQSRHDLEVERDEIGEALDAITPLSVATTVGAVAGPNQTGSPVTKGATSFPAPRTAGRRDGEGRSVRHHGGTDGFHRWAGSRAAGTRR